ncbi:hypothetical protein VTK26DRAFT_6304 [Humicola hyalothermophila]
MASTQDYPLHVAIVGAGITGINLALGLQARNVRFTLYERAPGIREIGAGIGFSPNAEKAMALLDRDILTTFKAIANPNGQDWFQWVDGYHSNELIFKLYMGESGFQGCRRQDVLEAWAKLVKLSPGSGSDSDSSGSMQFNKELVSISSSPSQLLLHFQDGTTAPADVVVGADGIRSRVRRLLVPPSSPAARNPGYTRKFCFRALVPMSAALPVLGPDRALTRFMYVGRGAHVVTYPVAGSTQLNVLAVVSDAREGGWPDERRHTAPGRREEAEEAFGEWHATVRAIVGLLPEKMDKWGIFDLAERPLPLGTEGGGKGDGKSEGKGETKEEEEEEIRGYAKGRVALAGDAAHATGPHLGAGAGMGIEDALALSELLAAVQRRVAGLKDEEADGEQKEARKKKLIEQALRVYTDVRYERAQDVVQSTRKACELFHWKDPEVARDPKRFGDEITPRFHKIWEYDLEGMVKEALRLFESRTISLRVPRKGTRI